MKLLAPILLGSVLVVTSDAFGVQPGNRKHATFSMSMTDEPNDGNLSRRSFGGAFGAVALGSILLETSEKSQLLNLVSYCMFFGDSIHNAFALIMPYICVIIPCKVASITVAETIKTLDMSLPSYDSISDSKASVSNVEGLAEVYNPVGGATKGKASTKTKESNSSGGNPLGAVLPSLNKSNVKKPKPNSAS